MTLRNDAALDFLLNRRSRPAKTLTGPAPSKDELTVILEAGTRVPDHGKLEPWRLKVLEKPTLEKIAVAIASRLNINLNLLTISSSDE